MSGRMLKYRISSDTSHQVGVPMPARAAIRAVGLQGSHIYVWAETQGGDPMTITRTFRVIPTGGDLPDEGTYLGTVFEQGFVWHVYEVAS
jgi:hypothetical protein